VNATARKPAAKKAAPAKKASKTVAAKPKSKAVVKPVVKKAAAKKPVAKKPVVKKAPAKAAKPAAKAAAKPVAKKAPAKPVAAKKPVAKKAAVKKAVAKKTTPVKAPTKASAKAPAKPLASKPVAKPVAKAAADKPVVTPVPKPAVVPMLPPVTVHKKNSRAAKMAALVPPPPAPVVASNAAKSSFMPLSAPSSPAVVPVIPKKDAKLANNWKTKSVEALTDAEVVAMPDSEYMNDVQMAFFRRKLVLLKQEVLSNASETTEHLREDTVVVPDPADRATIEEEHALELRTRDRERKLLKKIEQSIARIDAGDYGYCDETGEPIGVGRLIARPTATLSLEAQERRELKQKMFGD
jgi:DnaK suppressor protein